LRNLRPWLAGRTAVIIRGGVRRGQSEFGSA
jgi:hypothetical protein